MKATVAHTTESYDITIRARLEREEPFTEENCALETCKGVSHRPKERLTPCHSLDAESHRDTESMG